MNASRNSLRWLPAVIVPAVVVVGAIAIPLQAGAAVNLPDKSAAEVLLMVSDSTVTSFSGTVEQTSDLGLPEIDLGSVGSSSGPAGGGPSADMLATALEFASGSHTSRVFVDGPENIRVQVKDRLAERNAVSNGTDAWFYDSETDVATHLAIPADAKASVEEKVSALEARIPADLTPAKVADQLLANLAPSTTVSVGTDGSVAGRSVYELILTPKTADTLVESVAISVDSETGMPLRVTVLAVGQEAPAAQVGFSSIDFSAPSADLFDFVPPAGATVEEQKIPTAVDAQGKASGEREAREAGEPIVTGTGWSTIVEIPAGVVPAELISNPLVGQLAVDVDGGKLLSTSLVNVLLTTDGRAFAGSVPVALLQAAAQ